MPYGTVKVDNVTFTNNLVDATTTFSGIYASITNNLTLSGTATAATFTGTTANFTNVNAQNISVTTSLSGLAITGGTAGFTTITGTTVTGTTANFVTISGTTVTGTTANFVTVSGTAVTGNTGQFTNLAGAAAGFTTVTGTTITGTTANFVSGVFTTRISGTTVTGTTASFTSGVFASLSGTTHTITSGVFASGTAALPSISFISDPNTGIYSPGADQVAVATNGTQRLTVDTAATTSTLPVVHPLGAVGTPSITFTGDLNTGIYSPAADTLALVTAGNNTLHITSGGLVGIGTSVPVYLFQAAGTIATVTTFGNFAALQTAGGTGFRWTLNNDNTFRLQHTLDGFTNATVPIHIDSSDRVGIGTTSPTAQLTSTSTIQVTGFANPTGGTGLELGYDGTNGIIQSFNRATSAYKDLLLSGNSIQLSIAGGEAARIDSSRRLLVGTSTTAAAATELLQVEGIAGNVAAGGAISLRRASVGNSDQIGIIHFKNATEGAAHASISAICDGTPAAGDFPGALLFSTTADGAASPTERMRINSDGSVFISCISSPSASVKGVAWKNNSNVGFFYASAVSSTSNVEHAEFMNPNGVVGSISTNASATAYNTSSDYRLKENIEPVTDGITRLQKLKPSRFNFIADPDTTFDGFIAHEAQAVVPECVTGEKDAVDDDGNPKHQGIDQSKLVPLLTAALQEAIGEIESLKARLTAAGI